MQYCCAVAETVPITQSGAAATTSVTAELTVRLLALLQKMKDKAEVEDVHKLRTTVRRLEVHLEDCPKKVAQPLRRLRREAGKVRDLDVHLSLLKAAPFAGRAGANAAAPLREELGKFLRASREHEEKILLRRIGTVTPRLVLRLPKVANQAEPSTPGMMAAKESVAQARNGYLRLAQEIPEDPTALHRLRIEAKKLRYSLEPLVAFPEAAETAAQLRQVQEAIGHWHDWATMLEIADHELHEHRQTAAFHAIEARTQREFARARRAAERVRLWMNTRMSHAQGKPAATRSKVQSILGRAG
jgi:CHAD domain-containing protein